MRRVKQTRPVLGGGKAPTRREVLAGAAVLGTCSMLPSKLAAADDRTPQFEDAYKKLVGDRKPTETRVKLDMPDLAENGNMVPFSVAVESPMTGAEYVKSITILSTGNPQPVIATFTLSPASGRALISGRLRLARSQDVLAVAKLNTGEWVSGTANVNVTVGGCGG